MNIRTPSSFIGPSSFLQVTMTCITAWMVWISIHSADYIFPLVGGYFGKPEIIHCLDRTPDCTFWTRIVASKMADRKKGER